MQVNRVWFHLLGRGLVDPVDDFRASNPPSHPELLEALDQRLRGARLRPAAAHPHDHALAHLPARQSSRTPRTPTTRAITPAASSGGSAPSSWSIACTRCSARRWRSRTYPDAVRAHASARGAEALPSAEVESRPVRADLWQAAAACPERVRTDQRTHRRPGFPTHQRPGRAGTPERERHAPRRLVYGGEIHERDRRGHVLDRPLPSTDCRRKRWGRTALGGRARKAHGRRRFAMGSV